MTKSAQERAALLRQAASDGRRQPDDLFGARMSVHEALEGLGADTNMACATLLPERGKLGEWDTNRLEMLADQIENSPEARGEDLNGICNVIRMMTL